jgi:hypothetical protein
MANNNFGATLPKMKSSQSLSSAKAFIPKKLSEGNIAQNGLNSKSPTGLNGIAPKRELASKQSPSFSMNSEVSKISDSANGFVSKQPLSPGTAGRLGVDSASGDDDNWLFNQDEAMFAEDQDQNLYQASVSEGIGDSFELNADVTTSSSTKDMPSFDQTTPFDDVAARLDLENIDDASLPLLHIGSRIQSNTAGPTHQGYLILSKDGGTGSGYNILPCTAKRPWTVSEIKANVNAERQQQPEDWEVQMTAKTLVNYFEVEYHCYQKIVEVKQLRILQRRQAEADKEKNGQAKVEIDTATDVFDIFEVAVPKMLGIYKDDGSGDSNDEDVWGQTLGKEREWMVFAGGGRDGIENTINNHVAVSEESLHHLHSIQSALNLPEWYKFGDVMDVIMRSSIENLAFLTSCNIVHRNSKWILARIMNII